MKNVIDLILYHELKVHSLDILKAQQTYFLFRCQMGKPMMSKKNKKINSSCNSSISSSGSTSSITGDSDDDDDDEDNDDDDDDDDRSCHNTTVHV